MWLISYLISKTVTSKKLTFYKHLDMVKCTLRGWFFPQGGVSGCSVPSRFFVRWLLCVQLFLSFHSCIPSTRLLSRSWVKVKCRSKLCEGQPLCHSALWCCLIFIFLQGFKELVYFIVLPCHSKHSLSQSLEGIEREPTVKKNSLEWFFKPVSASLIMWMLF